MMRFLLLLLLIIALMVINLLIGTVRIPVGDVCRILLGDASESEIWTNIIFSSRLPQALTAIAAGAGVCEGDYPFHLRRVFPQQFDAHGDGPALGIARQHGIECHPVQFQEFVPAGIRHKPDDLTFIQRRAIGHDAMQGMLRSQHRN